MNMHIQSGSAAYAISFVREFFHQLKKQLLYIYSYIFNKKYR